MQRVLCALYIFSSANIPPNWLIYIFPTNPNPDTYMCAVIYCTPMSVLHPNYCLWTPLSGSTMAEHCTNNIHTVLDYKVHRKTHCTFSPIDNGQLSKGRWWCDAAVPRNTQTHNRCLQVGRWFRETGRPRRRPESDRTDWMTEWRRTPDCIPIRNGVQLWHQTHANSHHTHRPEATRIA